MRVDFLFISALAGVHALPTAQQGPPSFASNEDPNNQQRTAEITYHYKCKDSPRQEQRFSINVSLNNRHFSFAKGEAIDALFRPTSRIDGKDVRGLVGFYHQACGPVVNGIRCSTYFSGSLKTALLAGQRYVDAYAVMDKITDNISPVIVKTCHRSPSCPVVDPYAEHCQITDMATAG